MIKLYKLYRHDLERLKKKLINYGVLQGRFLDTRRRIKVCTVLKG